jgi:hypothetical protein
MSIKFFDASGPTNDAAETETARQNLLELLRLIAKEVVHRLKVIEKDQCG